MKLFTIRTIDLDGNYHGKPDHYTMRSTWQIVRMGSYAKTWTLYLYGADGRTKGITICFPWWRGAWPETAGSEPRKDTPQ